MSPLHFFVALLIIAVSSVSSEPPRQGPPRGIIAPKGTCKFSLGADIAQYDPDMNKTCTEAVRVQINKELDASLKYLSMGAYFSQDTVNLPGFAKFFFDSASEEREHAIKLMKYLSMRGELTSVQKLIEFPVLTKYEWQNGLKALEDAIELEQGVTKSIKTVIQTCDDNPKNGLMDYHISDWLTGEYLEEQYKSQRDLAGKIFSLKKLKNNREGSSKDLADFIFDKKLLGMDI